MRAEYLLTLIEKTSLIVVLFLVISKLNILKKIFEKDEYTKRDYIIISMVFTFLSILGTYDGIHYRGAILNTRIITIVSGGILFGNLVSIPCGIISGLHRFLIDPTGLTSVPCFISSISAGILSGLFYKKIPKNMRWIYGITIGMISESITILLIYLLSKPKALAIDIISMIYLPIIVGQLGVGLMVSIVETIENDKREIEERKKAEITSLQRQINPHFLFNALNTIASFIRFDSKKARELIIYLSTYLRHNLEFNNEPIELQKEVEQVKSYIEIEQARFGNKLNVIYDIDDIDIKIPSLIIQPLVENAIIHGILDMKDKDDGQVIISIKNIDNNVRISIQDNGVGISDEVIYNVYNDKMPKNKIGLYNVHLRLKLFYQEGLIIKRLEKGTLIEFYIRR